jgi:hypothetical protein
MTFLSYDPEVVALLPDVVRRQFPAHLTRKMAIDNTMLTLARLLRNHAVGFDACAEIFKELSTLHYYERNLLYLAAVKVENEARKPPTRSTPTAPWRFAEVGVHSPVSIYSEILTFLENM